MFLYVLELVGLVRVVRSGIDANVSGEGRHHLYSTGIPCPQQNDIQTLAYLHHETPTVGGAEGQLAILISEISMINLSIERWPQSVIGK